MANTFLAAKGHPVGKSLCEREMKEQALAIIKKAEKHKCRIVLPVDAKGQYTLKTGTSYGPDKAVWSYSAPKKGDPGRTAKRANAHRDPPERVAR